MFPVQNFLLENFKNKIWLDQRMEIEENERFKTKRRGFTHNVNEGRPINLRTISEDRSVINITQCALDTFVTILLLY